MTTLHFNGAAGTLTVGLAPGDTTMSSAGLADLGVVTAPDVAAVTLYSVSSSGRPTIEIVHVTAHTALATTATILRASEGTSARTWGSFATWLHGITVQDYTDLAGLVTTEAAARLAADVAHAAALDPHPGYLTPAEGNATYVGLTGNQVKAGRLDFLAQASGSGVVNGIYASTSNPDDFLVKCDYAPFIGAGFPDAPTVLVITKRGAIHTQAEILASGSNRTDHSVYMIGAHSDLVRNAPCFLAEAAELNSWLFWGGCPAGDTFGIDFDGSLHWGLAALPAIGDAPAFDTSLYRASAGILRTPGGLTVDGALVTAGERVAGSPWVIVLPVFSTLAITPVNWNTIAYTANTINAGVRSSSGAQNAEFSFFAQLTAGSWGVEVLHQTGPNHGIYSVRIDNVEVATIDGYSAGFVSDVRSSFGPITVATTGRKLVTLKMATKNASSSAYYGAVQAWHLLRSA